jgi:hypothetical protein
MWDYGCDARACLGMLYVGLSVVMSKQEEGIVTFITLCWQFGIAWWSPAKPGVCFHIVNNPGFMVRVGACIVSL